MCQRRMCVNRSPATVTTSQWHQIADTTTSVIFVTNLVAHIHVRTHTHTHTHDTPHSPAYVHKHKICAHYKPPLLCTIHLFGPSTTLFNPQKNPVILPPAQLYIYISVRELQLYNQKIHDRQVQENDQIEWVANRLKSFR